ncbi:DUF4396 domain-containing protein [Curtobacterium ammoniigenes]|uniref:DUF4396 domain-containing protein n=1 Tax=Curtobacterium ammoniigenes TaxID=395387 RepID=UPI000AE605D5|nr:DUF4396 domain-containing protein [Curtobacterium ammoniigenes]
MRELAVSDFPTTLTVICWMLIALAVACAGVATVDVLARPQRMAVMNVVWPLTMLFGSVLWLAFYFRSGRAAPRGDHADKGKRRMPVSVAVGASHCGAGCAIGDLVGEFALVAVPALGALVGLHSLYADKIFASWIIDFVIAFIAGVVFQYFSIVPMRGLSFWKGVGAALKADTLSITSWQVGMYGFMALAQFVLLPAWLAGRASVLTPEFWVAMQVAMIAGFACAYPVNWWLIRIGVKEAM